MSTLCIKTMLAHGHCLQPHLAHDLEEALFAFKHTWLAGRQALEVHLQHTLKHGGVDGHGAAVDGQLPCWVYLSIEFLANNNAAARECRWG
jgi:hypothetical protein